MVGEICVVKTGDGMRANVLHCKLITIATCLTIGAFASICLAQDAQLSDRALREIGFDSAEVLSTRVLWQDGSGNSITEIMKGKYEYLVTVRTRVHRENLHESTNGLLIIIERVEEIEGSYEDNLSELHAVALLFDSSGSRKQLWEFAEEADEGKLTEDRWTLPYYVTAEFGCCDARALYKAHSLKTGETVMRYHSNLREIGSHRFACFSKEDVSGQQSEYDSLFVGILYYANEDSVLHALKIRASSFEIVESIGGDTYYWPWTVDRADSTLSEQLCRTLERFPTGVIISSAAKSQFEAENVVAQVSYDGPILIIPIRDDDFVLEQTKVNGFELTRLK